MHSSKEGILYNSLFMEASSLRTKLFWSKKYQTLYNSNLYTGPSVMRIHSFSVFVLERTVAHRWNIVFIYVIRSKETDYVLPNKTLVLEYKYRLKTTELKAEIKHVNSNLYFVSGGTKIFYLNNDFLLRILEIIHQWLDSCFVKLMLLFWDPYTYPSPRLTFCLKWEESVNIGLGEG